MMIGDDLHPVKDRQLSRKVEDIRYIEKILINEWHVINHSTK